MKMPVPPGFSTRWHSRINCAGIGGVLNDPVAVNDIEGRVAIRQLLAVGDAELVGTEIVEREVFARKIDRGLRQIDAR